MFVSSGADCCNTRYIAQCVCALTSFYAQCRLYFCLMQEVE